MTNDIHKNNEEKVKAFEKSEKQWYQEEVIWLLVFLVILAIIGYAVFGSYKPTVI